MLGDTFTVLWSKHEETENLACLAGMFLHNSTVRKIFLPFCSNFYPVIHHFCMMYLCLLLVPVHFNQPLKLPSFSFSWFNYHLSFDVSGIKVFLFSPCKRELSFSFCMTIDKHSLWSLSFPGCKAFTEVGCRKSKISSLLGIFILFHDFLINFFCCVNYVRLPCQFFARV